MRSRLETLGGSKETVVGTGAQVTGALHSEGNVYLYGTVGGDLSARGAVIIGPEAHLEGNLTCASAVVAGLVEGNVAARQVTVLSGGRILGDVRAEQLATEEGASLEGVVTLEEVVDLTALLPANAAEGQE